MTTLNTIIEEEKSKFEKELGVFLMPRKNIEGREWSDKVFPCEGGYCTTDVQDIEDLLHFAMQRAYEAGYSLGFESGKQYQKDFGEGVEVLD